MMFIVFIEMIAHTFPGKNNAPKLLVLMVGYTIRCLAISKAHCNTCSGGKNGHSHSEACSDAAGCHDGACCSHSHPEVTDNATGCNDGACCSLHSHSEVIDQCN